MLEEIGKLGNRLLFCIVKALFLRLLHPSNTAVIREVYDSEYSTQYFSMELEKALESCCCIIVIEPNPLGEETARWITVGNYLHKTAVISGVTSIISGKDTKKLLYRMEEMSVYCFLKKVSNNDNKYNE